jgi:acyl transferase domain-containing protein
VTNNYNDINEIKESDIAVIGFSGRFPEADDAEQFWENLIKHKNCVREINRWNQKEFYDPTMQDSQKSYSKWGGAF